MIRNYALTLENPPKFQKYPLGYLFMGSIPNLRVRNIDMTEMEYLADLPPKELLEERLQLAIEQAKADE